MSADPARSLARTPSSNTEAFGPASTNGAGVRPAGPPSSRPELALPESEPPTALRVLLIDDDPEDLDWLGDFLSQTSMEVVWHTASGFDEGLTTSWTKLETMRFQR